MYKNIAREKNPNFSATRVTQKNGAKKRESVIGRSWLEWQLAWPPHLLPFMATSIWSRVDETVSAKIHILKPNLV
jgi:hypothetical protein